MQTPPPEALGLALLVALTSCQTTETIHVEEAVEEAVRGCSVEMDDRTCAHALGLESIGTVRPHFPEGLVSVEVVPLRCPELASLAVLFTGTANFANGDRIAIGAIFLPRQMDGADIELRSLVHGDALSTMCGGATFDSVSTS